MVLSGGRLGRGDAELTDAAAGGDCCVGVGVEGDIVPLLVDSVLLAARRYLPGDGFTGASEAKVDSDMEKERSGEDVEKLMEGATSSTMDFLTAVSSLAAKAGVARERFEEPEVDTVESEEEEGCEGWPNLEGFAGCVSCWAFGADEERFSWRSCGVLEKA